MVNQLSQRLAIERRDLIEKDIILHQLLTDLSEDAFFSGNFIFKGGTCLIKRYYGYERFSEDIDFTWRKQAEFEGISQGKLRKELSSLIDTTGKVVETAAFRRQWQFKNRKSDRNFIELGSSNKFCTFKVWYNSEILGRRSFFKVQINFVEMMCYEPTKGSLKSLATKRDKEFEAISPEYMEYHRPISFDTYDLREILSEKVRALLTRRGVKARDFLDIYLIYKKYHIKPSDVDACIRKKVKFAIEKYTRFNRNMNSKAELLTSGKLLDWGAEQGLLLSKINEPDFYRFISYLQDYLKDVLRNAAVIRE